MKVESFGGSLEEFLLPEHFLSVEQVAETLAESLKLAITTSEV